MANELKHGSVGTELTQAEWEAVGAHVFSSQAAGDIMYASSTSQLTRLGKGADNTVLHLASGIPAWSATLAGLTLTTPTISSTGFANANHAHAGSNSGGTLTALGTIATGVWQATDVGVAYGGTGVSTLTQNGVLVGNGASAIGSIDMSTKGHVLIGDGSGNPQMLGVGTDNHVMTADSGETTGVKWAAPAAAAAGSLTGSTLASGVVTTSATTVGVLNSGSINTGFGTINNGSSAITTTGLISGGSLDIDNVLINGTTIGHTDDTDLMTLASGVLTVAGEISVTTLDIGGTNVTSTAAELNLVDGSSANSVVNSKAAIYGGSGELAGTLSTVAQGSVTSVGTLTGLTTSGNIGMSSSNSGGQNELRVTNSSNTTGSIAQVAVVIGGSSALDARIFFGGWGGTYALGAYAPTSTFSIANDSSLGGGADSVRINTDEVVSFQNAQGPDFDYWCRECGATRRDPFECCGVVEWHDDVLALVELKRSRKGLEHMAKIGVMEIGPSNNSKEWIGINMQAAMHYNWSALGQMAEVMRSHESRLDRIEALLTA